MNPLVVTPSHRPNESLLGYALRVSEENGYETPWHMLNYAGVDQSAMKTAGFPHQKLAMLVGKPAIALEPISYSGLAGDGKREFKILAHGLGKSVKYNPLRLKHPSFCPQCVVEDGHINAFWDLTIAVACPRHEVQPISRCQECGTSLSWFRRGLLKCKCGAGLVAENTTEIPQAIIDLMSLLWAKLNQDSLSTFENKSNFPIEDLNNMPIRSFLALIPALARLVNDLEKSTDPASVFNDVHKAAGVFEDWPKNFHSFLRNYATKSKNINVHTASLRKRFESLYQSLFKGPVFAKDIAFMRSEFVNFGLQEWGDGIVDSRMIGSENGQKRYVSISELAQQVGVRPITIKGWAEKGKLGFKKIVIGNQTRYVGDTHLLPKPKESESIIMRDRQAAAYIGLPVKVLLALRDVGVYVVEYIPKFKYGYAEQDLINFKAQLLARSTLVDEDLIAHESVLSLEYVMQEIRFRSAKGKADFIAAYLEGEILSVGKTSESLENIYFKKSDVNSFAQQYRSRLNTVSGIISYTEASALVGSDYGAIMALTDAGFIHKLPDRSTVSLDRLSVESFAASYVGLAQISAERNTSSSRLIRLCNEHSVSVLSVPRKEQGAAFFIKRSDCSHLVDLIELHPSRSERVAKNKLLMNDAPSKLKRYLDNLRSRNELLPQRAGKPNKRKIAAQCGFDRNTIYQNDMLRKMLEDFENETRVHSEKPTICSEN